MYHCLSYMYATSTEVSMACRIDCDFVTGDIQATGPRPPSLANVKLDVEEESADAAKQEAGQQSFLRKYVSICRPSALTILGA